MARGWCACKETIYSVNECVMELHDAIDHLESGQQLKVWKLNIYAIYIGNGNAVLLIILRNTKLDRTPVTPMILVMRFSSKS